MSGDGPAQMGTGQLLAAMGQGPQASQPQFKMHPGTMFDTSEPAMVGGMKIVGDGIGQLSQEVGQLSPPIDYGHLASNFHSRGGDDGHFMS